MDLVKDPDGGFAIFEEEAAGFTYLRLKAAAAKAVLKTKFGLKEKEADALLKSPDKTWKGCVQRIRSIFNTTAGAHPCVKAALGKALENRIRSIVRKYGPEAV